MRDFALFPIAVARKEDRGECNSEQGTSTVSRFGKVRNRRGITRFLEMSRSFALNLSGALLELLGDFFALFTLSSRIQSSFYEAP